MNQMVREWQADQARQRRRSFTRLIWILATATSRENIINVRRLGRETGLGNESIYPALADLQALGYVERRKIGPRKSIWVLRVPCLEVRA